MAETFDQGGDHGGRGVDRQAQALPNERKGIHAIYLTPEAVIEIR